MSGNYYLNRERMRVVQRNDRGSVTYRKTYKFGQKVDTSKLDEGRLDALLASGSLVESTDDLRARRTGAVPRVGSAVTGAATGEAADHSEIVDQGEAEDDETDPDGVTEFHVDGASTASPEGTAIPGGEDEGEDDGEVVDDYSEMDYQQLQQAAGAKGIKTNQSAAVLRESLRNS